MACQRLFKPGLEPILIAPGDQRNAGGRADGRVGIGLIEAHALGGEAVQMRGLEIGGAIDAQVGPAQIVGQDENDIRCGHE